MPDPSTDEVYSSPQINIPPTFPFILKQYAKAAIRTQPYDLLRWSASYFRALAKGEEPPIKDRLEYPPPDTPSGLSPGYLKVLIKQIGKGGTITVGELTERWNGICLAEEPLQEMLAVGQFGETFDWLHFVAVAAGFLCNNLTQTMILLCNLLTDEPDGGSAMIPLQTFSKLYTFLASLDCGGPEDYDDDNENHEYIIAEEPVPLKRESVKSCPTDTSIYSVDWGSHSAHQLYMETHSPFPSPQISPPCTPCFGVRSDLPKSTMDNQLISTQAKKGDEKSGGSPSDSMRGSRRGSKDVMMLSDREPSEESFRRDLKAEDESQKMGIVSRSNSESSVGLGDLHDVRNSSRISTVGKKNLGSKQRKHVAGIGPIVDAVQLQAVIDYLEGVGLKQEGMVKPSNIRHFLCPPLEKVPASQRTRV